VASNVSRKALISPFLVIKSMSL